MSVFPTSRVGHYAGKLREEAVYCFHEIYSLLLP